MDPDVALANLREMSSKALLAGGELVLSQELAAAFTALDAWISKGGFLPAAWRTADTVIPCRRCGDPAVYIIKRGTYAVCDDCGRELAS